MTRPKWKWTWTYALAVAFCLAPGRAWADYRKNTTTKPSDSPRYYDEAREELAGPKPPASDRLDFETLGRLLKGENRLHRPVRSIEALLPLLPESLRSGFTLMFDSDSRQEADMNNPRAIVYGYDAKLVLAFNGDPSQAHFDQLEMIQFHDDTKAWELRALTFGPDPLTGEIVGKISESNPASCLGCHGNPPRPIWEGYPVWPGAFGGDDDQIKRGSPEDVGFRAFLARAKKHPRYGALIGPDTIDDSRNKHSMGFNDVVDDKTKYVLPHFPNSRLSLSFMDETFQRFARWTKTEAPRALLPLVIGSLHKECGSVESWVPSSLRESLAKTYARLEQDTHERRREYSRKSTKAAAESSGVPERSFRGQYESDLDERLVVNLRYASQLLGRDLLASYTLTHDRHSFDFSSIDKGFRDVTELLPAEIVGIDSGDAKLCERLQRKSLEALAGFSLTQPGAPLESGKHRTTGH